MSDNGNEPAFPIYCDGLCAPAPGLTKREWMAAMCLQAILTDDSDINERHAAHEAVVFAEALLAELAKGGE
jgi:hypothetical protein